MKDVVIVNKANPWEGPLVALLLVAFTGGILGWNMLAPDQSFSEAENRSLKQLPMFSVHSLVTGKLATEVEKYVADQFAAREFWVGLRSEVESALGKVERHGVYLGRDGFLLQKFTPPAPGDAEAKAAAIHAFADAVPSLRTYVMLVPTAQSVLADKLPPYVSGSGELAYRDETRQLLDERIAFVDVYPALTAQRKQAIFYKTDHHWTTKGAFYAYQTLARQMGLEPQDEEDFRIETGSDAFYGSLYSKSGYRHVQPDSIELYVPRAAQTYSVEFVDEQRQSHSLYELDQLKRKDKYAVFLGGNHGLLHIRSDNQAKRKLLVVKDSYANSLLPFLVPHFAEIAVVDLRYYEGDVSRLAREQQYSDMLLLYNVQTFAEDPSILALAGQGQ